MGGGGQMQKSLWNRNTQMCAIYGSDGSWMHESRGRESRADGWMDERKAWQRWMRAGGDGRMKTAGMSNGGRG